MNKDDRITLMQSMRQEGKSLQEIGNNLGISRQAVFQAGSCGGIWATVTCDKSGVLGLLNALIAALVANQSTYLLTPRKTVVAAS